MSGFNLWRNNSPLVTFSSLTAAAYERGFLAEALAVLSEAGKGLPPGWVSQHGDKRVQKQADGSWAYVPHDTQLGMQPFYKGSGETVTLTPDQEMHGYLKSINFDDPAMQKSLTGSPKFVGDMLKKFGAGWFDKYKKGAGKGPSAGAVPTAAPPPPPASSGSPVEQAMKQLNIAPASKEAFALDQFHKLGSLESAVDSFSKKFGMKYASAYDALETLMKKGSGKGVWSTSGDFDSGYKISFNVGTGPVISAPPVAATASAPSLGLKPELPKPVKAKKPTPSDSSPPAPRPFIPSIPAASAPTNPQVIALAAELGTDAKGDIAKALDIWRKHLKKDHTTAADKTAGEIAVMNAPVSTSAAKAILAFVKDLQQKVYQLPNWDAAAFMVDPEPAAPIPTPAPETLPKPKQVAPGIPPPIAPTPAPEIPNTLSIDKAVADMVGKLGYKMGSAGAVAVGMLTAHDGDIEAAAKGLAASLGWKEPAASKVVKYVQAKINAFKAGTSVPETPYGVAKLLGEPPPKPAQTTPKPTEPVVLPAIPPLATLSYAGDAKTKLGGNKPKKFLKDDAGNLYLNKYGADALRAAGGEVASAVAAVVSGPGTYVPVKAVEYEGDWGTVQPMVPNVTKYGLPEDPTELTADEIKQLQRERVIDWVVSNHDSKKGNFIETASGQIFGIDKEQAFKFIGSDKLDLDYSPNPSEPIYNALYKAYADKKIDLDPNDMLPFIQAVEKKTDSEWMELVKPYIAAMPEGAGPVMDAKLNAIVNRKNSLRKDFEEFFTKLKKKRGEAGTFTFAVPPPVPATPAPAAATPTLKAKPAGLGVLVPPSLPALSSMKYGGPANIGGAGEKHFFTDTEGKQWLVKVAGNKSTKKSEPWKVAAQTIFSMVGSAVKPVTLPVAATEFNEKPATIQPWLGAVKTLAGAAPGSLTTVQKQDVASEHILDWLMSQHDTHGGNLVIDPSTGAVIGIDKEQGFKYLLPSPKWTNSTPEGDKLSTDYHPNAQYGEQEPYYNKFWKAFADGGMNFDPTSVKGTIDAIEKIPDDAYSIALGAYGAAAFPEDAAQASKFYEKAFARKKNIRKDFEGFITDLYQKRTKKKGLFTFSSGWVPEGMVTPVAPATAQPLSPATPKPTTPPANAPVPPPAGFVPVPIGTLVKAASALGFNTKSVYYPALKQLRIYNNDIKSAAQQLSFMDGIPPEVALKRVKYAHGKLKNAGGWAAFAPGATPAASLGPSSSAGFTPVAALNPPSLSGGGTPMTTFVPGATDELGNKGVKLVTPSEAFKPQAPPPPPPVPPGFEPPPEGKMWELHSASTFFSSGGGGKLYKTKPPKKADGTPDTESTNLVAKFQGTSISAVEQALQKVGVTPVAPLKEKSPYVIGVFSKDAWKQAQSSDAKFGVLVPVPPPPPPPSGKFTAIPQAGELKNAPASAGMKELEKVQDSLLGFGAGFRIDGPAVEHHSMSVQRRLNTIGKPYYRFMFKLREPAWQKLKGFDTTQANLVRATYNAKEDAFKDTNTVEHSYAARKWMAGGGSMATVGVGDSSYALKGQVTCDVFPEDDQTPLDALRKLLNTMSPDLADEVLHDPTPEDDKLLGLSALYWSAAPADADALSESQRTVEGLTDRLKKLGYSQEQMDSIRFERVGVDQTVPVLPGRGKALQAKHKISHVSVAVSSPEKVMLQLRGGTVGCVQRLKHGFSLSGATSATSDIESGGGDYVFTKPGHKGSSGWENQWGQIEMVYDPSELDRLDPFMYDFDGYGRTKGPKFHTRNTLEQSAGHAAEIVFRQGLNVNKLLKIRCQSAESVQKLIQLMKDSGVTKLNGMTPEELVVKGDDFYDTFLKPGGY